MTSPEGTASKARLRSAHRALLALAAGVVVHAAMLMRSAPAERLTPTNVAGTLVLSAIVASVLGWLAFSVRRGRRAAAALIAVILYGLAWSTSIGVLAIVGSPYTGTLPLLATQGALACVYGWAVWRLVAIQRSR